MSVIMAWNIQRFGINKLRAHRRRDPTGLRLPHIISTVRQSGADLFVVIEVQTGAGNGLGTLITGNSGPNGVLTLLAGLQNQVAPTRQVVPPLIITPNGGYSEGGGPAASILHRHGPRHRPSTTRSAAVEARAARSASPSITPHRRQPE